MARYVMVLPSVAREIVRAALSRRIVVNSLKLSVVVGLALNLINQWGHVSSGKGILVGQLALNFLVPYCVATYSAVQTHIQEAHDAGCAADPDPHKSSLPAGDRSP